MMADSGKTFIECHRLQIVAETECAILHGVQRARQADGMKPVAINKSIRTKMGKAFGQQDRGNTRIAESMLAYRSQG